MVKLIKFPIEHSVWDVVKTEDDEYYVDVFQFYNKCLNGEITSFSELEKYTNQHIEIETVMIEGVPSLKVSDMVRLAKDLLFNEDFPEYTQLRLFVQDCYLLTTKNQKEKTRTERAEYEKKVNRKSNSDTQYSFKTMVAKANSKKRNKAKGFA